jgi:hypothetical protein
VAKLAEDLGIGDLVSIGDRVPHPEVRGILRSSDVLLLLAQRQPAQVPNKLYEYLGARRTVLAFVDAAGESAAMLREVGGHSLVTEHDSAERTVDIVETAIRAARNVQIGVGAAIDAWATDRELARLVSLIEEVRA